MKEKMQGSWTKNDVKNATESSNKQSGYSVELKPFQPKNIKMLVNLSEIEPTAKEYNEDIEKDTICQINMTPDGRMSIGFYSKSGNGISYYEIERPEKFKEGVHFEFK